MKSLFSINAFYYGQTINFIIKSIALCSEVIVIRKWDVSCFLQFLLHVLHLLLIHSEFTGGKDWCFNKGEIVLAIRIKNAVIKMMISYTYAVSLLSNQTNGFSNW